MSQNDTPATEVSHHLAFEGSIDIASLREFLKAGEAIAYEVELFIYDGGWEIRGKDPANVALVRAKVNPEAFDQYEAVETTIGIAPAKLLDALESFDDEGTVELELDTDRRTLSLTSGTFGFTYSYVDPDAIRESSGIPDMDLTATIPLEGERLQAAVNLCAKTGDNAEFAYDTSKQEFSIESFDTHTAEFRASREDLPGVVSGGEAGSTYSLDYTLDITEAIPDDRIADIEIGEVEPMCLTYGIAPVDGPGTRFHGEVEFMQAPRIQR